MARPHRSFFAHASALLGVLSLMGVVCFHFPDLLTSREFRAAYNEQFARHLLLVGLVAAFLLGTFAILRDRNKRIAMVGVGSATLAVLFGGTNVQFDTIGRTPYSLGLDWFVISLFSRRWCSCRWNAIWASAAFRRYVRAGAPISATSS